MASFSDSAEWEVVVPDLDPVEVQAPIVLGGQTKIVEPRAHKEGLIHITKRDLTRRFIPHFAEKQRKNMLFEVPLLNQVLDQRPLRIDRQLRHADAQNPVKNNIHKWLVGLLVNCDYLLALHAHLVDAHLVLGEGPPDRARAEVDVDRGDRGVGGSFQIQFVDRIVELSAGLRLGRIVLVLFFTAPGPAPERGHHHI